MNEQQQRWHRVGEAIRRRYQQDLHIDQAELVRRSGVSDTVVRALELGDVGPRGPRHTTIFKVEKALKWEQGSIDSILAGGAPTVVEEVSPPGGAADLAASVEELGRVLAALDGRLDHSVERAESEHQLLVDGIAELQARVARIERRLGA